ncbi:MAG TPA: DUF885 domain-containing protein [Methylomirabilota bacterium]|nr:DUF885 domain-containing protein [Methylomirabilota bacterium]
MKRLVVLLLALLAFPAWINAASADASFEGLANEYMQKHLETFPESATDLGDHRFDHLLTDYSAGAISNRVQLLKGWLNRLKKISPKKLSPANRLDYQIFRDGLESMILEAEVIREWEWNPLVYNPGNAIYPLLARDYAPLTNRLESARQRLEQLPKVLSAAQANLKNSPRIHTETAIQQIKGSANLVRNDLNEFIEKAPEMRDRLAPVQASAAVALDQHAAWLEKELLPKSTSEFRLGAKKFSARLRYSLNSNLSKEQILANAKRELLKTQEEMFETAWPMYQKYYPSRARLMHKVDANQKQIIRDVLAKLAEEHPNDETIVETARQALAKCVEFTRAKQIVTIPDEPLQIIVMPEFRRGVAVAYCDAPGPLAENEETFYAISPTPADWPAKRKESFYREYNNHMLLDLTIHEAVPGHYLQLIHGNKFQAPTKIRGLFGSGIFAEGWATYSEQVMVAHGFGGPEMKMQQLKMRLRLIINSMLDQGVHTAGMTEEEAMRLMMEEGFQEEGEAAGKWRRACLTSTQLSTYFVGNLEVNDVVAAYRKRFPGSSEQEMHDKILSYGTVPPKYLKELIESK